MKLLNDGSEIRANRASGGRFTGRSAKDTARYAERAYKDAFGWSRDQTAGTLSSLMGESGTNLKGTSHNPDDPGVAGSHGIAQWNRERLSGLKSYAKKNKKDWRDEFTQIDYTVKELNSTHKHVRDKITKAKTAKEVSTIWTKDYEVPRNANAKAKQRHGYIDQAYGLLDGKPPSTAVSAYVEEEAETTPKAKRTGLGGFVDEVTGEITEKIDEAVGTPGRVASSIGKALPGPLGGIAGMLGGLITDKEKQASMTDAERAAEMQPKTITQRLFGDALPGAKLGAIAGGLLAGGPAGALIGGVIGQSINAMLQSMSSVNQYPDAPEGTTTSAGLGDFTSDDRFSGLGGTDVGTGGNDMKGGLW